MDSNQSYESKKDKLTAVVRKRLFIKMKLIKLERKEILIRTDGHFTEVPKIMEMNVSVLGQYDRNYKSFQFFFLSKSC